MFKRLLLVAALATACHSGNPIEQRLRAITSAVEERDADDVAKSLSESFQGEGGMNKAQALGDLRQYLFGYRNISVRLTGLKTATSVDTGAADFDAEVVGNPKTIGGLDQILPRSVRLRFHVELLKESGGWKVTRAEWQPIEDRGTQ